MQGKTYTEAEVAALLGRAARLQSAGSPSAHEGLTLEEVKTAAADAGIDPQFVELAAAVSTDHAPSSWSIPTGVGRSLVVRGALTDDRWNQMIAVFARELGGPGETDVQGTRRRWSRGAVRVTAEETGGQTVLHAETNWGKDLELPIALTIVGAIAAATWGGLALVSLEWTIGVLAALFTLGVAGSFSAYRNRMARKQERHRSTLASTLDRCAAILLAEVPAAGETDHTSTDRRAGRIALPDADASEGTAPRPAERARQHQQSR